MFCLEHSSLLPDSPLYLSPGWLWLSPPPPSPTPLSPALGLASSFLKYRDQSSAAKLSCHPHPLSLPQPGRRPPGSRQRMCRKWPAGSSQPRRGVAACSPILRGDCLSALGRAWWEESGPGDAGGEGRGVTALRKMTLLPCVGEEGCPPPPAPSEATSPGGPAGSAGQHAAESMRIQLTLPRRAVSELSSRQAPCVCGCENVYACASAYEYLWSANARVSSLELQHGASGSLFPWPSPGNSGTGSH